MPLLSTATVFDMHNVVISSYLLLMLCLKTAQSRFLSQGHGLVDSLNAYFSITLICFGRITENMQRQTYQGSRPCLTTPRPTRSRTRVLRTTEASLGF